MTEYINPQEGLGTEGHFPNTENTKLELYRLLTIFLANKNFAELLNHPVGEGYDPFYTLQQVELDEITRLLLHLAITARVIDDREDRVFELIGSNCGLLLRNVEINITEELTLREACNKIVHATKIRYDVEETNGVEYLNPYMYLYGKQGKINWKATLDIVLFTKEYVNFLSCYS